ncbi:retrovirus-related pol polyprotein from transposon TNT 1-94 [Tanacetum coccineum]
MHINNLLLMPVLRLDLRCLKDVAIYHGQVVLEDTSIERERIESGLTRQLMKVHMSLEFSLLLKLKHQGCKKEDLRGVDLKYYEVEIEAMDLILISIPNDIYNSVDACKTVKSMWQRNDIIFPNVTVNIKFLNCLQPKGLKYVTRVRLAKRLREDSYDDLYDYLQQFEKLINASRAKKVENHMILLQWRCCSNNYEDPLTCAIILLAQAITQRFSNPTNNHLQTSSNTKNQAIVQGTTANVQCYNCSEKGYYAYSCPKPRVQDSKYFMENLLLAKQDKAGVTLTDEQNDFLFADNSGMEEIEELSANICLMARIQPANFNSDEGPSYDYAFLSEVQTLSTSYVNPLFAKDAQE